MAYSLKEIIKANKNGIARGIYSVCSANQFVIEAAMEKALASGGPVLIEATANQVNQYGGYSGMNPRNFLNYLKCIAAKVNFPAERIIAGGDHLGPLTWQDKDADIAMREAEELVRSYVMAGFTKIHIDTSMALADDNATGGLDVGTIARRGAALCAAAERAFAQLKKNNPRAIHPLYVIGSEVPVPGGASKEDDGIRITAANDFINTVEIFKKAYREAGLESAWENVIAVVVQPGVEFGNWNVHEYDRQAASELCMTLKKYPELVFEGHSTDYQTASSLRHMVEDGIAILKVGPALTFALREALFALNFIEEALLSENEEVMLSGFICKLEEVMLKNPKNWERHYRRGKLNAHYFRQYSYLDRCRYYLNDDEVRKSIEVLLGNLKCVDIPLPLLSQFMPKQYCKIRRRALANNPEELIKDRIKDSIDGYEYATSCNLEDSRPNNREVKN